MAEYSVRISKWKRNPIILCAFAYSLQMVIAAYVFKGGRVLYMYDSSDHYGSVSPPTFIFQNVKKIKQKELNNKLHCEQGLL